MFLPGIIFALSLIKGTATGSSGKKGIPNCKNTSLVTNSDVQVGVISKGVYSYCFLVNSVPSLSIAKDISMSGYDLQKQVSGFSKWEIIERIFMEMSNQMGKIMKNNILTRYFPVLIVLCIGILLSTLLFLLVRGWEQNHVQREFIRASEDSIEAINKEIEFNLDTLKGLHALYIASNKVERYEFHLAAKALSTKKKGLQAVEWIPRVADSRREEYEEAAKQDGFKNFQFMEQGPTGNLIRAARREEYFPVYYVEPYKGNEPALGFDLASNPERRKSLYRSRDSGNVTTTPRIILVQDTRSQHGVLVFMPVYKNNTPTDSLEERRENIEGFLLAVLRVEDIVEAALSRLKSSGVDIHIFDGSAQENERFLYFHHSRFGDGLTEPISYKEAKQLKGLRYMSPVLIAARKWLVICTPTPHLIESQKTHQPLIVFTGGALSTVILSSYVWFIILAGSRTRTSSEKLLQIKDGLEKEVQYSKKMQLEREELLLNLNERLKELNCLYKISNLIMQPGITLNDLLQETAGLLPESWQYPDVTCARIIFKEQIFKTDNYKDTEWKQSGNIISFGERVGEVEVCYIEKKPEIDEGPFLKEERDLIDSIAIQLGNVIEHKQTETTLESTRSYADNIVNCSLDMIITVNNDRKIVEFNDAAQKTFGYKKEEVLGESIEMLYESPEEAAKPTESLKRKGHFFGEAFNKKKSGEIFTSYVSASFILDKEGDVLGAMGISRDITKQKEVEKSLQESEMKFRSVTQSATDAIISANSDEKIMSWNKGAVSIFGYNEEEVLNKSLTMLMPERYRKAHKEGIRRALSTGEKNVTGKNVELEGLHKNGTEFSLELSLSTWTTAEGTFFSAIIRDVTKRKILEAHLSQAQKLESIGSLAAGIAHEINTPTQFVNDNIHFLKGSFEDIDRLLNKYTDLLDANKNGTVVDDLIKGIESFVEETDIDFLKEEIPKAIEASQRGANRVSTIVKAMKEFSHPGTKEKTPTNINNAIENTITVSKNEWKYVAEIMTDFDEKLPLVPCLPGDFNQVILNLITNAAHAISKAIEDKQESKGNITIRTRKDGDFVEITVSDTGAGIPNSIKDKIFYPFFTTKEVGKGTGQGLAISHSVIVDKHKGKLSFESEEGKGATFCIRLPLK